MFFLWEKRRNRTWQDLNSAGERGLRASTGRPFTFLPETAGSSTSLVRSSPTTQITAGSPGFWNTFEGHSTNLAKLYRYAALTRLSSTVWADVCPANWKQTARTRISTANARLMPGMCRKPGESLVVLRQCLRFEETYSRWVRVDIWRCSLEAKGARELYSEDAAILLHHGPRDFRPCGIAIWAVENVINTAGQAKSAGEFAAGDG